MGSELRVSEEHERDGCDSDSGVLGLTYADLDPYDTRVFGVVLDMYATFWEQIMGEDRRGMIEYKGGRMSHIEATFHYYIGIGDSFRVAYHGNDVVGFMCYNNHIAPVAMIKAQWCKPEYLRCGVGSGLVNSLDNCIKKVIFQTKKKSPPVFLEYFKDCRKIDEDKDMVTWEASWGGK